MENKIMNKPKYTPPEYYISYFTERAFELMVRRFQTDEEYEVLTIQIEELAKMTESHQEAIEEREEKLWKAQKGIDPETGKAWLTTRQKKEAKKLQKTLG
jgi:hypothetical protein